MRQLLRTVRCSIVKRVYKFARKSYVAICLYPRMCESNLKLQPISCSSNTRPDFRPLSGMVSHLSDHERSPIRPPCRLACLIICLLITALSTSPSTLGTSDRAVTSGTETVLTARGLSTSSARLVHDPVLVQVLPSRDQLAVF